jgi:hypothetical protein
MREIKKAPAVNRGCDGATATDYCGMYDGTGARDDGGVTGLGLVWAARCIGISLKYRSHVRDNSMR